MNKEKNSAYSIAVEQYKAAGVDVDKALKTLEQTSISMQCWQGDDVSGFENTSSIADGGIMATGDYPGRARTADELRADALKAFSMIPGRHRFNLHAIYAEHGAKSVARNELTPDQFKAWADWALENKIGLDFNPTFFAHPNVKNGFTLTSPDEAVRKFWVEHGIACRKIGEYFGKRLGSPCVTNVWIPDGLKDVPADRAGPRERLVKSLDEIFAEKIDPALNRDAVESKLFGIGTESYVAGSFEFYMGYTLSRRKILCLDSGHFHPTESIADKISPLLLFLDELLVHVSRGIRWDSDHIVTLTDNLRDIAREIVRNDMSRIHIALDYFDASVNRVAAWVIGMRSMQKALLYALLEPYEKIRAAEQAGDFTARLAYFEDYKSMPFGTIWNHFCVQSGVPQDGEWLAIVRDYEKSLSRN